MKNTRLFRTVSCVVLILLLAAGLRLYRIDWDGLIGAHPDERYIVSVAERVRDARHLSLFELAPNFAYGHLVVHLLAFAMGPQGGADPLLVGRVLAALFDVGTVALTFALGRQVWDRKVALIAAAFVALLVLHVQQAHFYTSDLPLAFFVLGALVFAARLAERGRVGDAVWSGVWWGLALGCKASALFLVFPLAAACAVVVGGRRARWGRGAMIAGAALLTFGLTNPGVLLNFATFWRNVSREAAIARGVVDVPYTRQFHATWPYVYPMRQMLLWGMGAPLGLAAFAGFALQAWWAVRRPPSRSEWVVMMWAFPFFAFVGALYAKFPRYLLPLTPVLMLYAARALLACSRRTCWLSVVCLAATGLHCLVFLSLYRLPHPWLQASRWIESHVLPGSTLAVEAWDHPLPVDQAGAYDVRVLPIFEEDTAHKWAQMAAILEEADYVIVASRRGYGSLTQWADRYPRMARYYDRLFDGALGFEAVACLRRDPRIGPLVVADGAAFDAGLHVPVVCQPQAEGVVWLRGLDESFVVYDHPRAIILRKH